jgi:hypothetical protein
MLSVPVFVVVVGLAVLLVGRLESIGLASLHPLLLLQFLLLASFLVICDAAGSRINLHASSAVVAGMLGVSAMAVQNVLVQKSLKGAPSTAVMTTNVTRFAMASAHRCWSSRRGPDSRSALIVCRVGLGPERHAPMVHSNTETDFICNSWRSKGNIPATAGRQSGGIEGLPRSRRLRCPIRRRSPTRIEACALESQAG